MPFSKKKRKVYDAARAKRVRGTRPHVSKAKIAYQGGLKQRAFVAIDSEGGSFGPWQYCKTAEGEEKKFQIHRTFLWMALQDGPDQVSAELTSEKGYLNSREILTFLADLPLKMPYSIFVAFGFNYDVVQAIVGLPEEKLWELQNGIPYRYKDSTTYRKNDKFSVFCWGFKLVYIKGKKFSIQRKGSSRSSKCVIYDVISYFQSSFIEACNGMPVDPVDMQIIREGKAGRKTFSCDDVDYCRRYTSAELRALNAIMQEVRKGAQKLGLKGKYAPRAWHGPGALSSRAMALHKVHEHYWPMRERDAPDYQLWAMRAYFGGHVENTKIGVFEGPGLLFTGDIRSAYPAGHATFPSMKNGEWRYHEKVTRAQVRRMSVFSMVHIKLEVTGNVNICPLPYRRKGGGVLFPTNANGYYFAEEARAAIEYAEKFDEELTLLDAWEFLVDRTQPKPFAYLAQYYEDRNLYPKPDVRNTILKLIVNSTYGKTAQKVGTEVPKDACIWYAGAITANTRATIMRVAMQHHKAVIAMMTDGIVATKNLSVPVSKKLGDWETATPARAVFLRSGIYSLQSFEDKGPTQPITKTRGMRVGNLGYSKHHLLWNVIPEAWARGEISLQIPYKTYVTLGVALASKSMLPALGCWIEGSRELDIRQIGPKRHLPYNKTQQKHLQLCDTRPADHVDMLRFLSDEDYDTREVELSAMAPPDWYLTDDGFEILGDAEQDELALAGRERYVEF